MAKLRGPRGNRGRRPWRRRAVVEQLEPRILLSADLPGEALDAALPPPFEPLDATEIVDAVSIRDSDGVAAEQNASSRELVFVDGGVDDLQMLLDDLLGRGVEVRVLDTERDGVEQIGEILAAHDRDLDAVHLVSHGSEEGVQLGGTWLTLESLPERAESLAAWRGALAGSADLLLYGCDLAASSEGKALVEALATLTGADVAASTDLTGAAALGGDWDLEYATGAVESAVPFSTPAQQSWQSVLDYIEDFETWSASSSGSWEVVDLSGAPFNVPANAVLEIAVSSDETANPETGGVRAFGSSLDRSFALHEADNNSLEFAVMHVQADASSRIETYASDASNIQFTLLGYWDSGSYVETDGSFTVAADGTWQDQDLSGFGIGAGNVAEIVIANQHDSEGRDAGVRTNDSTLARILRMHDASGGGVDTATLFVQADDTVNARIEAYAEVAADLEFHVVGYWSSAPGTYTEARSAVGSPSADQSWDSVDLGPFGVPGAGVAEFTLANDQGGASDNDMGVRASGSSLARTLDLNDRSAGLAGGADLGRMHVVADSSSGIEFYHRDISDSYDFYLTGYWSMPNHDPSADGGGPYDIAEGDPVTLDASSSADLDGDLLTYAWDINGDLTYGDVTGVSPTLTWAQLRGFGIDDDGTHTVAVRVDDSQGGFGTASATINVANTAPTLTVSGAASVVEDNVYTLNLSATDPGDDTIIGWTINWGDGTIDTVGDVSSATHIYTQSGFTRNITASARDGDGAWTNSDLLVGNYRAGSDEFYRFDGVTGAFDSTVTSANAVNKPYQPIVGPDGDYYVAGYNSHNIGRYDSSGNYLGEFVTSGSGGLSHPDGLAFGADGNLYVANYGGNNILRFDSSGNFIDVFGTGGDMDGPSGLAFGPDGDLYAASWDNGNLVRFDGRTGGVPATVIDSGLTNPEQIVFGTDGDLYIADGPSNTVKRWDGSTLTTYFSDPSLEWGSGVAFGPDGSLYISSYLNDQILRFDGVTGEVFVAAASGGLDEPEYLSFTPDQQVLVNHRLEIPTVTPAVTDEDTQTSSGLVIDRGASDGLEVTHFKITNITNGTLYQNDGSTVINDGDFITFAEGNAGLKFTPALDYSGPAGFEVQASTTGDDTDLSTAVTAAITVTSVNDAPELDFTVVPVLDPVAEDAGLPVGAVGTLISSLIDPPGGGGLDNVSDVDVGASTGIAVVGADTSNGTWHYSIDGGSSWNSLGAVDGDNARLLAADASTRIYFEPDPDYNGTVWPSFVFRAWDQTSGMNGDLGDTTISGGTSSFSAMPGIASINVTPVNDAPTAIDAAFVLAENSADGTVVGTATASDVDSGDSVSYAITGGDPGGAFAIDAATGEITVNDSVQLDFETSSVFNLTVTVTDAGGLTDTATITVSLTDVNEAPTASDVAFALAENSADGTVVGSVSASDVDAGDTLSYAITGGDPGGAFAIDAATGEITVNDSVQLDFETSSVFNLTVTVTDAGGLTDTATITVSLTDVNEAPTASDVAFALAENSADGTVVGSVSASDVDAGDTLSYAITGGDPGSAFAIDAATGEITVNDSAQLDFETAPVLNLTVTVTDAGGLTDTAAVTISLADVNEAPTATDAAFGLAENSADGTVVGSVSASDVDAGDTLSYAITAGDSGGAFAIDSATGEITVNDSAQLDFETTPVFNLTVTVTDAGGLTDTAAVTVSLTDVNEAPTATDAAFALAENSADGTAVGSVSASDVDAGDSLSYAITAGDPGGAFVIDSATGEITVADSSQLDFETTPVFNLTVTVTDAGGLTDDAAVTVSLTDVNEAPTAADAAFVLAENSADGAVVGTVSASDVDAGDTLSYAITGGDPGGAFSIDAATGAITVNDSSQLDFETSPVFNLTVTVTDASGLTDTAAVAISLTNVNEVPTASDSAFALAENSADATVVGSVSASDVDAGDTLSYAITGGDPGAAFTIDTSTGEITVADSTQLDFETTPVFNLTVTVTDAGGLTDTAAVTISLADVNEAPTATDAAFGLAENSADGTVVGSVSASDVDAGDTLSYAITAGDSGGAFAIDSATGEITVNDSAQLDFETTPVFNLTVTVTDAGGLTDTAAVTVSLTDVNEAPTATDAAFALAENSADGTAVGSVSASDVDAGDSLSYAITAGDPGGAFVIDSATGEITVADSSQLDFETTPVFNLTVTVTDAGGLTDDAAVTVSLTDVNEAPTAADAAFVLAENSADGAVVGTVSASDVDAGDTLSYAITGGDPGGAFSIDAATGAITVNDSSQLDFETSPVFNLTVTVTDASGLTDTAAVAISLTNVNEVPTASDSAFALAENSADATVVGSVSASDVDAGDTLSYAITGGDPGAAFTIDTSTGEITVADSTQLDFETTPVFNLTVTVTDAGGLTDTAAITVSLTDVNEAPTAVDAAFVLAENSADGTVVGSVSASDVDAGDTLSYAITGGDPGGAFSIDSATGEITVADSAQLDFETSSFFNLTVTVTDVGGLTDTAAVTVTLTDVNEAPAASDVAFILAENSADGTVVGSVSASDVNAGDTLSYAITAGDSGGAFAIDSATGEITVNDSAQLDFETSPVFNLTVTVTDAGGLTDDAAVTVSLTDVNEAPTAADGAFVLAENSADGAVVGTVSASDVDAGDTLSYAITAGDPGGAFVIDSATAEITVADSSQLDFETTPVFNLTVTVTDAGGLTDTAAVTVSLTDVNEAPTVTDAAFVLAENSADGTAVGSVSASDVDAGDTLSYAITGGDPGGAFSIDAATGEITVADSSQLDFETTPVFNLTVTVTDAGGLTDDAAVTVSLTDVNEAPTATDATFVLAENSADGNLVGSVSASDVDAGGSLSYAITAGDPGGAFVIDSATGEITVADSSQLDFETTPVFNLTVTVANAGGLTDTAAVTVSLTDVNEVPTATDATFVLAENSADGTVVGSVSASDVDAGDTLSYAITGGDPGGAFSIDAATGEITVNDSAQLDFETMPVFNLTVTVTDAGGLTDDAAVTVSLTDVNEAPTATDATFVLAENSADGNLVGSVSASDVDAGGSLSYAITAGDPGGAFVIDSATGEITVADSSQLDFETTPVFNLTVTVTDAGGLTDTAAVTVSLTDVNEAPTASDAAFVLAENSADGTLVGSVSASDVDAGDTLSYAITGGDPGGAFSIDAATGEITVDDSTQLDFETTPIFNLTVAVTDSGGLTDTAAVTISLADVNEAPTASDASFVMAENSVDGTLVGTVSASDVEAGDTLSYAITGGDPSGAFAVDEATGAITVNDSNQLDFETTPVFNLTVTVTDARGLTDTAAVTINLTDVNEAPAATDAAFALAENSSDGTVVGMVSATDVDAGDTLSYAITSGDPGGAFSIDAATGEITVADSSQLDFETTPVFNLTVTVTDAGGLTDDAAVTVSLTDVNEAPTATDATFVLAENSADGNLVGSVSASDVDAGGSLSYAITAGDPGGAFVIDSATGEITVADSSQLDFETTPVFNLTVTVTDAGGLTDTAAVTVSLTDVNEAPTATDATFVLAENSADGTVVGSVSASDVDAGDTLSYAITGGDPGGAFSIDAATGEITVNDSAQLDFETMPVFNLTVTITDAGGLTDTAAVTVSLTDVNEAPVLAPTSPTLPSITEDEVDNAGVLISSFLGSSVSDPDTGAVQGIAITSLSSGNGTWQVQVGAGTWTRVGSVSDNRALLLQATDKIRFVPDGRNADAASFTYRAWDQTSGSAGAKVSTSANGGATAFSTATDTASISVSAVNDAPRLGDAVLTAVEKGAASSSGETVADLFAGRVSDVDAGSGLAAIAVVGNGADASTQGVWEYSTDGGASWFAIGSVGDDATALVLSADTLVRFVPAADFDGAPAALVVRGLDDSYAGGFSTTTSGSENRVNIDTTSSGGTSAIAAGSATISTSISPIEPSDPPPDEEPVEIDETITDPEEEIVPEADPTSTDETPEAPAAGTELPQVSAEPAEPVLIVPPNRVEGVSVDLSRQPNVRYDTGSDALSVSRTAIELFQKIFENEALIVPGASVTDLIFEQTEFLDELDRLQDEIDSFVGLEMTMAGSSIAVTMGLSIGYVIWLTRGGLLLASLLSSLPAWRLIDPIAVLAHLGTDDEDDRDDGESLDSLLSRSSRPEGSRLWSPEPKRVEAVRSESLATGAADVPAERDPDRRGEE